MGIQEYPVTPTERASRKAKASAREQIEPLEENDAMGTMMVGSDEKSTTRKHQVYSHLDDMPAQKSIMASDKKKEGVNQIASETKIKMEGKNFDSMSPGLKET